MKYVFFLALTLLSFNGFSQNNAAFDSEFEKLPPAQQKQVLGILLLKAGMDREIAQITPELTITGMEGFKFKTQTPMVAENNAEKRWKKYKDPNFVKTPLSLELLVDKQSSALEYLPFEGSNYTFRFYSIGSEFTIKSFIHVGSKWMFILTDKSGTEVLLDNEHHLDRMLEGDSGNFDGQMAIILDWLTNGKTRQTVKAESWTHTGLTRLVESLKNGDNRHFPVVKNRQIPSPEPKTKGEWINYFLKNVTGKQAIITNEKEINSRISFDIEADTEVLMLLVYADFISPYAPDFKYHDAYDRHRLFQNQDEANLIGDVLHKKRKRSKEQMEELKRIEDEIKKNKQQPSS